MDTIYRQVAGNGGNSSTAPNASSPGNAITGGYEGDSFAVKATIVFFSGMTLYNALELLILIFFTFSKFSGLYFYSLLVSSIACIPYALGFLFKLMAIMKGDSRWLSVTFITIGWYGMVTGQSVVLWSRLHLLVDPGEKGQHVLRWTKWMIIIDAIVLHIPTTVLTYGSNGNLNTSTFVRGYNIMEKIQMCGFFLQEVILSALYIRQASKLLRHSMRDDAKKFFVQLVGINILIIIMDVGLLATEAASLYLYETIIKGTIYSIKLKLEFAILGKLINFVGGRQGNSTANEDRWRKASAAYVGDQKDSGSVASRNVNGSVTGMTNGGITAKHTPDDLADFVDLSKVKTDVSHASHHSDISRTATNGMSGRPTRRRNPIRPGRGVTEDDVDLARFEHADATELPEDREPEEIDIDSSSDEEDVRHSRKVENIV